MLSLQQLHQYGQRIDYPLTSMALSVSLLNDLIWQHVSHIPFEGLAPHLGEAMDITNLSAIFEKLIVKRRGGWCYEMNALFFHVLEALGFDVGYGNIGLTQALALTATEQSGQMRNGMDWQLMKAAQSYCYRAGFGGHIEDQYRFVRTHSSLTLADLVPFQQHMMTSPTSPFVKHRIVKIATETGFKKLLDDTYTEYAIQEGTLQPIKRLQMTSVEDYSICLTQHFNQSSSPLKWLPPVDGAHIGYSSVNGRAELAQPSLMPPMSNTFEMI